VELGTCDVEVCKFFIADSDACVVVVGVKRRSDDETSFSGRTGNQVHDHFVGSQRAPSPVFGDEAEQSMLNLVPLTGAWWKVAHFQGEVQFVGQFLKRFLPEPIAAAVASPAIRSDEQLAGTRESWRTHLGPPPSNARRGELGGVMIDTHTDPTFVARQIVDTVGNRLPQVLLGKVVNLDLLGFALRLPLLAGVLEFPDQLLLFRVDRDHGLVPFLKR
jgi:hypothetical protein